MISRAKILCVDDEPHVLEGLSLNLRRWYDVTTALNCLEGLLAIQEKGPFAVVLSDMRMPGMDGATFLTRVRDLAPDTCRMLLTGHTDMQAAIAAVNQGQIFRFLTKPCPPIELHRAIDAAVEQHRLITSERVLLEQTLHGSIKTLVDVLSMANPLAFGRATRVKENVGLLADKMDLPDRWQLEVAAMLSQLGSITLPPETVEKVYYGGQLTEQEQEMADRTADVTEQLLANIPRLEVVRGILSAYTKPFSRDISGFKGEEKKVIEQGAHILRISMDYDILETQGYSQSLAIATMRSRSNDYDLEMLEIFATVRCSESIEHEVRDIHFVGVRPGMVFASDVKMVNGALLAARGYVVTESFVERARNFRVGLVKEPIRVILHKPKHGKF